MIMIARLNTNQARRTLWQMLLAANQEQRQLSQDLKCNHPSGSFLASLWVGLSISWHKSSFPGKELTGFFDYAHDSILAPTISELAQFQPNFKGALKPLN